ncbi:MAG TPA: hypothetical protein VFD98_08305 [Terracidiphilus sp.]|jgi:hypothetical protein|nr:hypothetical protein [Terracidiphilus sp.]
MKIPHLFAGAVVIAALCAASPAQQAPIGFHTVNCVKIKPDKMSEYRKWGAEEFHKFAQGRVDSGAVSTYYRLRAVMPAGSSAECDYVTVWMYPGAPPAPLGTDELGAALKKAGLNMSGQEFMDRRDSMSTLVSNSMFQNQDSVGKAKKGDYMEVSYMKASDVGAWIAFEEKVWKPLAEQMVKDGVQSGWSVNVQVMPFGTDVPYQGVTVDVYPSWDTVFKAQIDPAFNDRFKKVHPDMDQEKTFANMQKVRSQSWTRLFVIEDMISAAK